ncbi:hypothetical protein [Moorena producens]|uniref:hypothetical protein n=1 Tax=Moorena producens TaxID=1155739 RepID=UPI003C739A28
MVSPTRALHQDGSREKGTKILTIPTRISINGDDFPSFYGAVENNCDRLALPTVNR